MLNDYYYSNSWKQDFQAILVDKATEIAQVFTGDEEFLSFGNDLKQTAEEQHYEDILTDVFSDDYTTSWGESVGEQEKTQDICRGSQCQLRNKRCIAQARTAVEATPYNSAGEQPTEGE